MALGVTRFSIGVQASSHCAGSSCTHLINTDMLLQAVIGMWSAQSDLPCSALHMYHYT